MVDLKTSEEWQRLCKINIIDFDGWDSFNFDYSWKEEKISREEFENRMFHSTIFIPKVIHFGDPKCNIWKDKE